VVLVTRSLRLKFAVLAVAVTGVSGVAAAAASGGGPSRFGTDLIGYEEVPAVSTTGDGNFSAKIRRSGSELHYRLEWRDLSGPPTQAHIHFGQFTANGGISIFLCSNLGNGPAGTAPCPAQTSGEVSGTATAAQVVGPSGQGIDPGEFDELVRAMQSGVTYANVHTGKFPGGEIRGQLGKDRGHDRDDD
jgi:hypothetical protein